MAEFCVDCWNKINGSNYSENEVQTSECLDLCEGCGEYKNVIIEIKERKTIFDWLFRKM